MKRYLAALLIVWTLPVGPHFDFDGFLKQAMSKGIALYAAHRGDAINGHASMDWNGSSGILTVRLVEKDQAVEKGWPHGVRLPGNLGDYLPNIKTAVKAAGG